MGVYCATKAAIEVLAETYRYELSSFGVDSVIVEPGAYPTGMVKLSSVRPGDQTRVAEYGPLAERVHRMFGGIVNMVSGPNSSDPQEVADAVSQLIETPLGQRPLRTLVGQDAQGAAVLNNMLVQSQRGLMEGLGLADLMSPASQS
jgi:NAD(P)-dependent dehydrogenase (short-subunit alcohol dehydrogenase family)